MLFYFYIDMFKEKLFFHIDMIAFKSSFQKQSSSSQFLPQYSILLTSMWRMLLYISLPSFLGCIWILLILLKIKNWKKKKKISGLLFTPKTLFICLFALFMSHEQCNRLWLKKKKKKEKRKKKLKTQNVGCGRWIQTLP